MTKCETKILELADEILDEDGYFFLQEHLQRVEPETKDLLWAIIEGNKERGRTEGHTNPTTKQCALTLLADEGFMNRLQDEIGCNTEFAEQVIRKAAKIGENDG